MIPKPDSAVPAVAGEGRPLSADKGKRRIEWVFQSMPVLQSVRKQFIRAQPFAGLRFGVSLPASAETANLLIALRDAGGSPALCPAGAHQQQDVLASLTRDYGIPAFAPDALSEVAAWQPHLVFDDGGRLTQFLHQHRPDLLDNCLGGTEETTEGVVRLKALSRQDGLRFPVIAMYDAMTRHLFDNRYGTGQTTIDSLLRTTNILVAGSTVVVAGYGWCGRGIAARARGMGANVIVSEIDPIKALEALMDGYRVMSMSDAAALGDVFITVTGNKAVIHREHFEKMKNGAILCNSGHFNVEIDVDGLTRAAASRKQTPADVEGLGGVEEYVLRDGRRIYMLSEGQSGVMSAQPPASVLDLSFANQVLCAEFLVRNHSAQERLKNKVYAVPEQLDRQVARWKLDAMGIKIDRLSVEQEMYLSSCSGGAE
ncbi:MAG: adenosylhomocysteinase [Acidobacteria bacterium]|nr:adenosylhomocysteinase [Acidobacteriota bacterium]